MFSTYVACLLFGIPALALRRGAFPIAANCGVTRVNSRRHGSFGLGSLCLGLFSLSLVCFGMPVRSYAQIVIPAELTFRSSATEVRVTFSATDQNNRTVANIQPNDFAIVDQDFVVREFRSFTRSDYTRLDVVILADLSGSISPQFRQELSNVVRTIVQHESDGLPADSFSVISFRDLRPTVVCDGNCSDLNMAARFPAASGSAATPLYDSIVFASHMLSRHSDSHTRKIEILFSDGLDTISLNSYADALNTALNDDVAIYSVDLGNSSHASAGTRVLSNLAAGTGGRYFSLQSSASIIDAIVQDFHATYTVAYKLPSHVAGFHLVRILPTHNSALQFHCRSGYFYSSDFEN